MIFSSNDFTNFGEPKSVLKALERMANSGVIIRVTRGIYCYPKIDKVLGVGVIYPAFEEIAQYIAKRDKARIVQLRSKRTWTIDSGTGKYCLSY